MFLLRAVFLHDTVIAPMTDSEPSNSKKSFRVLRPPLNIKRLISVPSEFLESPLRHLNIIMAEIPGDRGEMRREKFLVAELEIVCKPAHTGRSKYLWRVKNSNSSDGFVSRFYFSVETQTCTKN